MRLPCAHIFHQRCIVDWLTKHCTCPVCRYELETEDAQYEKSRKARMKGRKPRIHGYELERMSLQELKALAKQCKIRWPLRIRDKNDIIEAFAKSNRIDIIAAPKPVEYALHDLRQMGVAKLRRSMEAAGVFFDPIDVVEKEDMVRIFCNSGRLVVLPDPPKEEEVEEDRKPAAASAPVVFHPEPSAPPEDLDEKCVAPKRMGLIVETVTDDDDNDGVVVEDEDATNMFDDSNLPHEFISADRGVVEERTTAQQSPIDMSPARRDVETDILHNDIEIDSDVFVTSKHPVVNNTLPPELFADQEVAYDSEPEFIIVPEVAADITEGGNLTGDRAPPHVENDAQMAADYARFESYTISNLRNSAKDMNVDLSRCIERSEMVEKLVRALNGKRISDSDFDRWSVSELLAVASAVNADLSHCGDRTAMVRRLVYESEVRPHVADYLGSLMPLAHLSISQLRALAREWRVSVSDCIEKEEMIHRLVTAATPAGSY